MIYAQGPIGNRTNIVASAIVAGCLLYIAFLGLEISYSEDLSYTKELPYHDITRALTVLHEMQKASCSERYYLSINTDVFAAVIRGSFQSGYEHWEKVGREEGRKYSCENEPYQGETFDFSKSKIPAGEYTFRHDAPAAIAQNLVEESKKSMPRQRVLLFITTQMSDTHIYFLKSCWHQVLLHSSLVGNADVMVYMTPINEGSRSEGILLLNSTFAHQKLTVHVRSVQDYQLGAMMALSQASLLGWFEGYDWVIRLNPDVIVRDDTFLVDTIKNDHNATALLTNCVKRSNGQNVQTDFSVFKPDVLQRYAFLVPAHENAEMSFTFNIKDSILGKGGHRWIPNTSPMSNQCRMGAGRAMFETPITHYHPSDMKNMTCPVPFL